MPLLPPRFLFLVSTLAMCLASTSLMGQTRTHAWRPVTDGVYLQEVGRQVRHESPITAVSVFQGEVYVGDVRGALRLAGDTLVREAGPEGPMRRLVTVSSSLWGISDRQLYRKRDGAWRALSLPGAIDVCAHRDQSYAITSRSLLRLDGE